MVPDGKTYAEKATQTIQIVPLELQSPWSSNASMLHSPYTVQDLSPDHSGIETPSVYYSDDDNALGDRAAYTYSKSVSMPHKSSLSHNSQLHLAISDEPRAIKPIQIPYSRPSSGGKRVVSLPEAVPLNILARDARLHRVVSLPGPGPSNIPSLGSPTPTQDNLTSMEYFDTSLETSYRSSLPGSAQHNAHSCPPSDMPSTPSPPSSPEPILVVSNEAHVPNIFPQCHTSDNKVCDVEDGAGWITWAMSPPRPIPALHGPLSLPYARCPSGAEGTIIEDTDLPRMIWGLDLDDTPANSNSRAPSKQIPSDSPLPAGKRAQNPISTTYSALFDVQEYQETLRTKKPQVWDNSTIDISALDLHQNATDSFKMKPDLNPSPPVSLTTTPRIFIEPRTGSQITSGRRLSAIEIAQRYHAEHKQNALPAVSNPLRPSWSPNLTSASIPTVASHSIDPIPFNSRCEHQMVTHITSPEGGFGGKDFPSGIRQIEAMQRNFSNTITLSGNDYSDTRSPSFSPGPAPAQSPSLHSSTRQRSTVDNALNFKGLGSAMPASLSQDTSRDPSPQQLNVPLTLPRILKGTRPQSIPMTRLIQRRLSTVAEEESSFSTNSPPTYQRSNLPHNRGTFNPKVPAMVTIAGATNSEDKENTIESSKATNIKKWRPRRRIGASSDSLESGKRGD